MKFFRALLCAASLLPTLASAGINNPGTAGSSQPLTNPALSGVVGFSADMIPFVNSFKMGSANFTGLSSSFLFPNFQQAGSSLPIGTIPSGSKLGYAVNIPSNYLGQHVIAIQGSVSGTGIGIGSGGTYGQVYSKGAGTTIVGCSNGNVPPCYFQNNLTITGTNPTITFDLSAPITNAVNNGSGLVQLAIANADLANGQPVTVSGVVGSDGNGCGANGTFTITNRTATTVDLTGSTFDGGCTYTSGGQLFGFQSGTATTFPFAWEAGTYTGITSAVMCRLADYNADNTCNTTAGVAAWPGGFNDDFITKVAALKNHHLRFLDVNNIVFRLPPDWANFPSTNAFTYNAPTQWYIIPNWFGSTSGTNSYSVTCNSPCTYALTGEAPKDGDMIQFFVANANTNASPTITITDINGTTSSTYPMMTESGSRGSIQMAGSPTAGDTVAVQFNTTPVGAFTCLAGGTHTTTPYTVTGSDSLSTIGTQLANIINADSTLGAQPQVIKGSNPNSNGKIGYFYASNACIVTATLVVTGAGTETANIGTMPVGAIGGHISTAIYKSLHNAFLVNTDVSGGTSGAWPYSIQVALANAVSKKSGLQTGCWLQTNLLWSDASFLSFANWWAANPCSGDNIPELANEIWNPQSITGESDELASSIGLGPDSMAYYMLRMRQLWPVLQTAFNNSSNLKTTAMFQLGGINNSELSGTTLCGTGGAGACANNQAYQATIGVNYNSAPNRPVDFINVFGEAPYYTGSILNNNYQSSGSYTSWSATSSSVSGNVLTVAGTVTGGPIRWNHGVAGCDGAYTAAPTLNSPYTVQLSGTVTTTLNGAITANQSTITLTSTAGLSVGMWLYNVTNNTYNGTIGSINSGFNQITIGTGGAFASTGSNDTIVFGGLAGTYQLNSTSCNIASGTITGGVVLGLQYAVDNYCTASGTCSTGNVGLGSVQDAFNWMYDDTYLSVAHSFANGIKSFVTNFNTIAASANLFGKVVRDYEGGLQTFPPNSLQATSMGLPSSGYGATNSTNTNGFVYNLLAAWKNNGGVAGLKALETLRHNNELALLPSGSMTMWYADEGGSQPQWGLYPGDLASTPFQSYNAICAYNGGSC